MADSYTTFVVCKGSAVYVVEHVPCLLCPACDHTVFRQEVAKQLERYTSGRVVPQRKAPSAWAFRWDDPIIEVTKDGVRFATQNSPVSVRVRGTAPV
ncbi:MAG: YgiT-type zinc finger protein [Chloroflexi bacterium]|nr:YgiT-type zinc finger protein [Chloroflexota bacterium]